MALVRIAARMHIFLASASETIWKWFKPIKIIPANEGERGGDAKRIYINSGRICKSYAAVIVSKIRPGWDRRAKNLTLLMGWWCCRAPHPSHLGCCSNMLLTSGLTKEIIQFVWFIGRDVYTAYVIYCKLWESTRIHWILRIGKKIMPRILQWFAIAIVQHVACVFKNGSKSECVYPPDSCSSRWWFSTVRPWLYIALAISFFLADLGLFA